MSTDKFNCFFLDACILLPQKNRRFAESCADFLKQAGSKCYASSSVKETILDLLDYAYDWITKEIQSTLCIYMEKENIRKVTCRDGLAFERFFSEIRRQMRMQASSYIFFEIIGQIEHWAVSQLLTIPKGSSVKFEDFLAGITLGLSTIYEQLKSSIEVVEGKEIIAKPEIKSEVVLRGVKKMEDIIHLASAIDYQFSNNVWVVFVTFDEDHILRCQKPLFEICALRCSKPMYASEHLKNFSRMDKPFRYYCRIEDKTREQLAFAEAIEKSLNIKITS